LNKITRLGRNLDTISTYGSLTFMFLFPELITGKEAPMAINPRRPSGQPIEPLLDALSSSVDNGYRTLEHVLDGLRESLRRQVDATVRPDLGLQQLDPPRPLAEEPALVPAAPIQGAVGLTLAPSSPGRGHELKTIADLLSRAGEFADEVAAAMATQSIESRGDGWIPTLSMRATGGGTATTEFTICNTGELTVGPVTLAATDLVGVGLRSPEDAVTFDPPSLESIEPGRGVTVLVKVNLPGEIPTGQYRGVVTASPGDACAVLELTVTPAARPSLPDGGAGLNGTPPKPTPLLPDMGMVVDGTASERLPFDGPAVGPLLDDTSDMSPAEEPSLRDALAVLAAQVAATERAAAQPDQGQADPESDAPTADPTAPDLHAPTSVVDLRRLPGLPDQTGEDPPETGAPPRKRIDVPADAVVDGEGQSAYPYREPHPASVSWVQRLRRRGRSR
jgi:hypothetical protein